MALTYKTLFSPTTALLFTETEIVFPECTVKVNFPIFGDVILDSNYWVFANTITNKDYWKNQRFIASNRMEYLCGLKRFYAIENPILDIFIKLFPNLQLSNTEISCGGIVLDSREFDLITDIWLVSFGSLSFEDYYKKYNPDDLQLSNEELEWKTRMEEANRKINRIHSSKNAQKQIEIHKMCMYIISCFPQYKLADLPQLTYYQVHELYSNALAKEHDKIQQVALGNGLIKNGKYESLILKEV